MHADPMNGDSGENKTMHDNMMLQTLLADALALPIEDRARLIEYLIESLDENDEEPYSTAMSPDQSLTYLNPRD